MSLNPTRPTDLEGRNWTLNCTSIVPKAHVRGFFPHKEAFKLASRFSTSRSSLGLLEQSETFRDAQRCQVWGCGGLEVRTLGLSH